MKLCNERKYFYELIVIDTTTRQMTNNCPRFFLSEIIVGYKNVPKRINNLRNTRVERQWFEIFRLKNKKIQQNKGASLTFLSFNFHVMQKIYVGLSFFSFIWRAKFQWAVRK